MEPPASPSLNGAEILRNPALNKGTAFTRTERAVLGLEGLLPPRVNTQSQQVERVLENLRRKSSPLEKFIYLAALQDRNETLFYRVVMDHIEEVMPLIYTPTVGQACQEYAHIFRRPRGLYITPEHRGRVAQILRNWPERDVRVIVVTDGERILGLGDLGANGMGIPVGKLALYTACAGIPPRFGLPVMIDVGTNNEELLSDPLYFGLRQPRLRYGAYDDLLDEFVTAVQQVFPHALVQFEDFANHNAFRLLKRYRARLCTFNDDIQGTAAVTLAGLSSALRITGQPLSDQTLLFFGAGEAGTGIADLIVSAMKEEGLHEAEARARCWFVDSEGLVVRNRGHLAEHKKTYAHDHAPMQDPLEILKAVRPTALIGVCGHAGTFSEPVLRMMAALNERPIIFALSNPTSASECTAEEAYRCTDSRAIFASGSPFPPVSIGGRTLMPGQGNNAFIFPGIGLGVIACCSRLVCDEMFLSAAGILASCVTDTDLEAGRVYPPLARIREVSAAIATTIAELAYRNGLATCLPKPEFLAERIESLMYEPAYESFA